MPLLAHRSGLHGFTQLPQNYRCCLAAMCLISQACHASPFRSVQIKPSFDETNHTDVLLGLPQPKPKKLVPIDSRMRWHRLWLSSHTSPRILDSLIGFWLHMPPCRPYCLPIYEARESSPYLMLHGPTRASWSSCHTSSHPSTHRKTTSSFIWRLPWCVTWWHH